MTKKRDPDLASSRARPTAASSTRQRQLNVELPVELHERLDAWVEREGLLKARAVARLIEEGLEERHA